MKDAAIEAVLERTAALHELGQAVRPRHRHACGAGAASPSASRPASRIPRRSPPSTSTPTAAARVYFSTVDMGQGSDTAMAQIAAEVLHVAGRSRHGGAFGHRRHALRHGDARLALALPHRQRGQARRRRRQRAARLRCARSSALPPTTPIADMFRRSTACGPARSSAPATSSRPTRRPMRTARRRTRRRSGWWARPVSRSRSTPRPGACRSRA